MKWKETHWKLVAPQQKFDKIIALPGKYQNVKYEMARSL